MTTRHYVDVGGRRVHYRRRGAGAPVVLLHESPRSSAALLPLIDRLGDDMTLFAFDTPGYGQSDDLARPTTDLADYGDALADTLAALGIARAPVYGTHTGAGIAYAFALGHPDRCTAAVLDGFPIFSAQEREEALANYLPPFRPAVDGTHLAWLWSRVRDQTLFFPWYRRGEGARLHLPPASPAALQGIAMDMLRAGDRYRHAYTAAFAGRPLDTIAAMRARVVIGSRRDDVLLGHLDRLPSALPAGVTVERFPADRAAWGAVLRAHFVSLAAGAAPPPAQATLPLATPGSAYLDLPGGQMHLRGAIGGAGLPLLLLHPLPGGSAWFADTIARLAGIRPVIAPDLPGAGDSDPVADTVEDVLDALDATVAALGIDAFEIGGIGLGAELATRLSARDPGRRRVGNLEDQATGSATPPDARTFAQHPFGAHLFAAWHHARDEIILGPWTTRVPKPFAALDAEMIQARTVELLKARGDHSALIRTLLP